MRGDRGSATVVAIAVLAVAIIAGMLVAGLAGAVADRAQARAAADLAALAGAYAVRDGMGSGGTEPCAVARRTAMENGALLTLCHVFGDGSVQVTTASGNGTASARAGPESEGPGGGSG